MAALVHTPTKKKVPTGRKRGRPTVVEMIAKTNYKVSDYYKAPAKNADRPMQHPEEAKERSETSGA